MNTPKPYRLLAASIAAALLWSAGCKDEQPAQDDATQQAAQEQAQQEKAAQEQAKREAEQEKAKQRAEQQRAEQQEAYVDKLVVSDIAVKEHAGTKRVLGKLANDGDQVLERVDLTITFLDKSGDEVHTDTMSPVLADGKADRAFGPGHAKRFTRYANGAPEDWDGEVEISVSDVEFFEQDTVEQAAEKAEK